MPLYGQIYFQDAASSVMMQMTLLHDQAMIIITLVLSIVGYALISIMKNSFIYRHMLEAQKVETAWTILPGITLLFLAVPSLRLLYLTDEISQPVITLKAIGHQWYWSYEYSDFENIEMDSYMTSTSDLVPGEFRLLEVDNRAVIPMNLETRIMVTAADVIHSWTIPSLGLKVDAIPGRLNQLGVTVERPGVYYGQCSEICGANHSFMPIVVEVVSANAFTNWITKF